MNGATAARCSVNALVALALTVAPVMVLTAVVAQLVAAVRTVVVVRIAVVARTVDERATALLLLLLLLAVVVVVRLVDVRCAILPVHTSDKRRLLPEIEDNSGIWVAKWTLPSIQKGNEKHAIEL